MEHEIETDQKSKIPAGFIGAYEYGADYRLAVFSRQGDVIDVGPEVSETVFDWMSDNRLVYAVEHDVFQTKPGSANGEFLFRVAPDEGQLQQFAVSPDGQKLAMMTIDRGTFAASYGQPWVIDLNTLEARLLAHADDPLSDDENARIKHPTWSPDGRQIALLYGATLGGGPAELYVVSADADNVLLSEDNAQVVQVQSWYSDVQPGASEPAFGSKWLRIYGPFACIPTAD